MGPHSSRNAFITGPQGREQVGVSTAPISSCEQNIQCSFLFFRLRLFEQPPSNKDPKFYLPAIKLCFGEKLSYCFLFVCSAVK